MPLVYGKTKHSAAADIQSSEKWLQRKETSIKIHRKEILRTQVIKFHKKAMVSCSAVLWVVIGLLRSAPCVFI
jgi:hypothetical protein